VGRAPSPTAASAAPDAAHPLHPIHQTNRTPQPKEKATMAEMFYDDDADLSVIQGK
jgi:hypothetical protein